jgi:uncharacterized LabA/DUF88 family protein
MARIFFFVDGLNLYHAFEDHEQYRKYKWISVAKLCKCYVTDKRDSISGIEYFTALAIWDLGKVARHTLFIKAQQNDGVEVVYGEFKIRDRKCRICKRDYKSPEEKQTDVNIALHLFELAIKDRYDKAIVISGDTDLLPAIKAVRRMFPSKQVGVVIPIGRASEDLKKQTDFHYRMKEKHLISSRYPDLVTLVDGSILACPPNWK